jgi:hypothetical protein
MKQESAPKKIVWIVVVIVLVLMLVFSVVFNSLGSFNPPEPTNTVVVVKSTGTPVPDTATPDPCSKAEISVQIARVHALTREFEDTAQVLTSTLLRDSSVPLVQDLQRIRRSAEDQIVPPCLENLKAYQVAHMNARIDVFGTALAFMNVYGPGGDQKALNELLDPYYQNAILAAMQYEREYATLLGLPTPTPPAVTTTTAPE